MLVKVEYHATHPQMAAYGLGALHTGMFLGFGFGLCVTALLAPWEWLQWMTLALGVACAVAGLVVHGKAMEAREDAHAEACRAAIQSAIEGEKK